MVWTHIRDVDKGKFTSVWNETIREKKAQRDPSLWLKQLIHYASNKFSVLVSGRDIKQSLYGEVNFLFVEGCLLLKTQTWISLENIFQDSDGVFTILHVQFLSSSPICEYFFLFSLCSTQGHPWLCNYILKLTETSNNRTRRKHIPYCPVLKVRFCFILSCQWIKNDLESEIVKEVKSCSNSIEKNV